MACSSDSPLDRVGLARSGGEARLAVAAGDDLLGCDWTVLLCVMLLRCATARLLWGMLTNRQWYGWAGSKRGNTEGVLENAEAENRSERRGRKAAPFAEIAKDGAPGLAVRRRRWVDLCVLARWRAEQAPPLRPNSSGTRRPRQNPQLRRYFFVNSGGAIIRQCAMNRPTGSYAEGQRMRHPPNRGCDES
jgi:hypothetical protein